MKLKVITECLKELLLKNHYNSATIHFYEREWKKIQIFLMDEYGDTEYEIELFYSHLPHQASEYPLVTMPPSGPSSH